MSGSKPGRQSLFFRDLASPVSSAHRGAASRFATPGQAAAVSALWREGLAGGDPPPPPVFTLDDRADFSPEPAFPASPEPRSPTAPPSSLSNYSPSPFRIRAGEGSGGPSQVAAQQQQQQSPGANLSWWSPARGGERDEKGKGSPGSPVNGVVNPGALITLPPPREVARPEMQRSSMPTSGLDEEEWITVYGFPPEDTNLVLREFEKCGVIVKHVPGPRDANWMHILYQSRYDAQKALQKNGMQINSVLIVGVKLTDPTQCQILNEKMDRTNRGFMVSLPSKSPNGRSSAAFNPLGAVSPYLQTNTKPISGSYSGAIASPAKSVVSKVMDLMFGI